MFEVILVILLVIGMVYCIASIANAWQAKKLEETEPVMPVKPWEVEACVPHAWKEVAMIKPDEIEAYKKDPDKFPPTTYCDKCGYIPSRQMQVTPRFREILREQYAAADAIKERAKEIETLSEDFYKTAVEHLKIEKTQEASFRAGYEAYANFVSVLPGLVERNRMKKLMDQMRGSHETVCPWGLHR